jgi:protein phosphatase
MNPPTPLVGWQSQQGTRGKENDDHYGWFALERPDLRRTLYLALVADGVTSTEGGAQASRIAVEAVRAALSERPSRHETLSEWLANAVVHANEEILFEARRNPQWKGMSSTVVLAALAGEKLYVMHLGDSRAYLLRENRIYQLTTDHTWAQEALDAGAITAEEAEGHPGRNQLQRFLGAQQALNVARGVIAPSTGQMEEYVLTQPGDAVLLCTDGLYRRLTAESIKQTIIEHTGYPQQAVEALVADAAAMGEVDDITALLVELPNRPVPVDSSPVTAPTSYTLQTTPAPRRSPTWSTLLLLSVVFVLALITIYLLMPPG